MSNADFYNNIQKQAASIEDSYPELKQIISSQQQPNKKPPQEKSRKFNIQMNPREQNSATSSQQDIKPSLKIEKPSNNSNNKITFNKNRSQSTTIISSAPSIKIDNKNQNNNNATPKSNIQKSGLTIKLDPSKIKLRSKSSDIEIKPQSIVANKVSDNTKEKPETTHPPGFENFQTKPQETSLDMPPGFNNLKATPLSSIEKENTKENKNDAENNQIIKKENDNLDKSQTQNNEPKILLDDIIRNQLKDNHPQQNSSPEQKKAIEPSQEQKTNKPSRLFINPAKIMKKGSTEYKEKHEEPEKDEKKKELSENKETTIQKEHTKSVEILDPNEPQHKEEQLKENIEPQVKTETPEQLEIPEQSKEEPTHSENGNAEFTQQHQQPQEEHKEENVSDQKIILNQPVQTEINNKPEQPKEESENLDQNQTENAEQLQLKEIVEQPIQPSLESLGHLDQETHNSIDNQEFFSKKPENDPHHLFSDDTFDDSLSIDDFQFDYNYEEEEEEEEDQEDHERIVILPSQLVAQPLEIEKRTPISTNISVESIKTDKPFASYEDLFVSHENQSSGNDDHYVNFDSSQFPTSYGINEKIAYAFKQKGSRINVFELNLGKLTSFQYSNLSSITAKGNVIVGSGNNELSFFKISKKALCSHNKFDLPDAISLVADPLDKTRFFYLTTNDRSLYVVRNNEVKTKKELIAKDVISFDICSKYLIIVSASNGGLIRCTSRKEGMIVPIWERQIPSTSATTSTSNINNNSSSLNDFSSLLNSGIDYFITDDYYIEKVGKIVTIYDASSLSKVQTLTHIVHVFKGGGNPLFLLTNGIVIHFKDAYRFPRPVICAVANRDNVIAWYSLDYAPYAKKTESESAKHSTFNKHTLKVMHTAIITKTTNFLNEFSSKLTQKEKLFKVIDDSIAKSEKSITKFSNSINELTAMVKSMTPSQSSSSPIDECFRLIENSQYENSFSNSLSLEKKDFIQFLNDKRIEQILHSIKSINNNNENDNDNDANRIILSDDLLTNLALKIITAIEKDSLNDVEKLVLVLLRLPDEKRKFAIQSMKDKISVIINEFANDIQEENILSSIKMLNQLFSSSVA